MPESKSNPRAALRAAIAERGKAKEAVAAAELAVSRGRGLLAAEHKRLDGFGDVDGDITAYRAAKFKTAAKGGPSPNLALPDELRKRLHGRDEAVSARDAAKAALDSLTAELKHAEAELSKAERKVSEGATRILLAEALGLTPSLSKAWKELWAAVDSLGALSSMLQLPAATVRELQFFAANDYRQFPGNSNAVKARAVAHWRSCLQGLRTNADADVSAPAADNDAADHYERVA